MQGAVTPWSLSLAIMGGWLSPAYTSSENGEGGGAVDLDEIEALARAWASCAGSTASPS